MDVDETTAQLRKVIRRADGRIDELRDLMRDTRERTAPARQLKTYRGTAAALIGLAAVGGLSWYVWKHRRA